MYIFFGAIRTTQAALGIFGIYVSAHRYIWRIWGGEAPYHHVDASGLYNTQSV